MTLTIDPDDMGATGSTPTPASASSAATATRNLRIHTNALEDCLAGLAERTRMPSLVVLVEAGGEQFSFTAGAADRESQRPPTAQTVYGLGSVSKAYAGLAVLKLVSDGRLGLHDPISKLLGDVPDCLQEATVHHLLTHTSGLPPLDARYLALDRANPDTFSGGSGTPPPVFPFTPMPGQGFTDHKGLLTYLSSLDIDPLGPPGRWFSYSNEAYVLVSGVVAEASGQTYEEFVNKHVLAELGLTRTAFIGSPEAATLGDTATPYAPDAAGAHAAELKAVTWWDAPAWAAPGGILASAADLLAFAQALQSAVPGVDSEILRIMSSPHAPKIAGGGHYGYGLGVNPAWNGHTTVGHGGGRIGTSASMSWIAETGATAVGMSNISGAPVANATAAALAASCGLDPAAPSAAKRRRALPAAAFDPERLIGTYSSAEGARITVQATDGQLLLRQGNNTIPLVAMSADQFVARDVVLRFLAEGTDPAWAVATGARILTRTERRRHNPS